jgi:peptide chain release factor 3
MAARWVSEGWEALRSAERLYDVYTARDRFEQPVLLFRSDWHLRRAEESNPELGLSPIAPMHSV